MLTNQRHLILKVTCFSTVHEDLSRLVTVEDPARVGEHIRIYMTGLEGAQPVDYGAPNPDALIGLANPPALADPGAAVVLAFRLSPGLVGIQQLDLRVVRPFANPDKLFENGRCAAPPVR